MMRNCHRSQSIDRRRGFTLIELLVVIAIIAVLGGLTALGYRGVANDSKLASGKNTVSAVLDLARGLAMKNSRPTMVMFVPRLVARGDCRTQVVIAEWTGDVIEQTVVIPPPVGTNAPRLFERFVPVANVQPRLLPKGITVAGPNLKMFPSTDDTWTVPSNLAHPNEAPGRCVGVLFLKDGTTTTTLPATATYANNYPFVDFDDDGVQDRAGNATTDIDWYFIQVNPEDEPCTDFVPYLAVFNEQECREIHGAGDWNVASTRQAEQSTYITQNADRIHFNRYSGVAMK